MCFIEAYLFEPQMLFKIFQYRNTTQMTELIIHENIFQGSYIHIIGHKDL